MQPYQTSLYRIISGRNKIGIQVMEVTANYPSPATFALGRYEEKTSKDFRLHRSMMTRCSAIKTSNLKKFREQKIF